MVGVHANGVRLIQVKRAKKDAYWQSEFKRACEAMREMDCPPNVSCEVWVWVDYTGFVTMEVA